MDFILENSVQRCFHDHRCNEAEVAHLVAAEDLNDEHDIGDGDWPCRRHQVADDEGLQQSGARAMSWHCRGSCPAHMPLPMMANVCR